jgi:hypothetical protein
VSDDLCKNCWQDKKWRPFLLTWLQCAAVGFEKNMQHVKNNVCVPNDDYVVSVGFQRANRKVGNVVTLHQRELFKKIPGLNTFRTVSKRRVD